VVASNIADFILKNDAGILVNPEDPEEVSNAIIALLQNEQLREKLGKNGRKLVIKYNWENTALKILEVFKGLLN